MVQISDDCGRTVCAANLLSTGYYESDTTDTYPIVLSQFFANNHCYAYNYADETISIGVANTLAVVSYTE
jgi:hypothetical protein